VRQRGERAGRAAKAAATSMRGFSSRRAFETINFLGLVTGSLGKIGFDIMLLMMTELGEAFEPFASHRGASSTMRRSAIRFHRKSFSPTPRPCASTPA